LENEKLVIATLGYMCQELLKKYPQSLEVFFELKKDNKKLLKDEKIN
jgi:hypothetical protein